MKVLIPTATRFLRPRNTDWHYAARTLPSLPKYCPELTVTVQDNLLTDAEVNLRYCLSMAHARGAGLFPRAWAYSLTQDCPLYERDIERTEATAILSYERYPSQTFGLPVAWITSPSYPDILEQQGMGRAEFEQLVFWKRSRAERAGALVFTTQVALDNFIQQTDESLRAKSIVIPFLIPGLHAVKDIAPKWTQEPLRFLFVGRQAHRKGLPATLAAMIPLLEENPEISLTVVSSMDDGPVPIPNLPNITLLRETDRSQVLQLMANSHVLVMPSSWESYGFVYIEAMSQGCVPLALDHPIQRELIGECGILVSSQDPQEINAALRRVVRERETFFRKALVGLSTFRTKHSPQIIAGQFHSAMRTLRSSIGVTHTQTHGLFSLLRGRKAHIRVAT